MGKGTTGVTNIERIYQKSTFASFNDKEFDLMLRTMIVTFSPARIIGR